MTLKEGDVRPPGRSRKVTVEEVTVDATRVRLELKVERASHKDVKALLRGAVDSLTCFTSEALKATWSAVALALV